MQEYTFIVDDIHMGLRLDAFLGQKIPEFSREKLKKSIQGGHCLVDSMPLKSPSTKIRLGQQITICLQAPTTQVQGEEGDIYPLWHDAHMLVCDKPAGITVHPCPSCQEGTFVQRLVMHFPQLLEQDGLRPGIVHRLDKDTSGLLVIALTEESRLRLSESFAQRHIHKEYMALVHGVPPKEGEIHEAIGRDPKSKVKMAIVPESKGGRAAHSTWKTLYSDTENRFSLVQIRIYTGRTHQIRVHMAHLGFPLLGDHVYGKKKEQHHTLTRHMLHAWFLELPHPITEKMHSFMSSAPQDMLDCAVKMNQTMQKIILTGLPGCGKSALLDALQSLGLMVWSADAVVGQLYSPGNAGHAFLRSRFHNTFAKSDTAPINRIALRKAMQEDSFLRQEVECAIHAMVQHDLQNFWNQCRNNGESFAAAEIPLYLENGWQNKEASHIVGIHCPTELRHARLKEHRNWSQERSQTIDSWQLDGPKKMSLCHTVINNDADITDLHTKAQELLNTLQEERIAADKALLLHLQTLWNKCPITMET